MGYQIEFYETENGKIPVKEFVYSLEKKHISKILREIDLLADYGHEWRYPHTDTIKGDKYKGLQELRIKFASDIFRIFYFVVVDNKCIMLHGIQKKTQKTPQKELDTALQRMKDYTRRDT